MKLRINKLISDAGLGSRRDAEDYIRQGRVKVNGRRATLADLVGPEDSVYFDEVDLPVKDLIRDHLAEEKLQAKEKKYASRSRTRDKRTERAESQRQASAAKSAALRKTSKNNPENRRLHKQRIEGWDEEEQSFDERALRHRNSGRRGAVRQERSTPKGRLRKRRHQACYNEQRRPLGCITRRTVYTITITRTSYYEVY